MRVLPLARTGGRPCTWGRGHTCIAVGNWPSMKAHAMERQSEMGALSDSSPLTARSSAASPVLCRPMTTLRPAASALRTTRTSSSTLRLTQSCLKKRWCEPQKARISTPAGTLVSCAARSSAGRSLSPQKRAAASKPARWSSVSGARASSNSACSYERPRET